MYWTYTKYMEYVQNILRTFKIYWEHSKYIEYVQNILNMFKIYWVRSKCIEDFVQADGLDRSSRNGKTCHRKVPTYWMTDDGIELNSHELQLHCYSYLIPSEVFSSEMAIYWRMWQPYRWCTKIQLISKQNCRTVTSPKKRTKRTQDTWEKLRPDDNFGSRSTDL